jgi:hypothetical protein
MEGVATWLRCPQQERGRRYAIQRPPSLQPWADPSGPASSVRSCVRSWLGEQSLVVMNLLFKYYSALKDVTTLCGREDSNLQPVSRPNPKFDGGLSRQSAYVRLVLVCAGESGIVSVARPVGGVLVVASAAGFVRSFVRSLGQVSCERSGPEAVRRPAHRRRGKGAGRPIVAQGHRQGGAPPRPMLAPARWWAKGGLLFAVGHGNTAVASSGAKATSLPGGIRR